MTPAQEAGLVIGKKYRSTNKDNSSKIGTIGIFVEDDGSEYPAFQVEGEGCLDFWMVDGAELVEDGEDFSESGIEHVEIKRVGEIFKITLSGKISKKKLKNILDSFTRRNKMTKYEAAVVSAYTGYMLGNFSDMHEYAEKKFGYPISTHMFADKNLVQKLKDLAYNDFIQLEVI